MQAKKYLTTWHLIKVYFVFNFPLIQKFLTGFIRQSKVFVQIFSSDIRIFRIYIYTQYNLSGSNPDGSFTVDDSNSFFNPYKIIPVAQENKYLGIFSYFIMELYVVCTH